MVAKNILEKGPQKKPSDLHVALFTDEHVEKVDSWRMEKAFQENGINVTIFEHPKYGELSDKDGEMAFYYKGKKVDASQFDSVVLQTWGGNDDLAMNTQELWEKQGVVAYNPIDTIRMAESKMETDKFFRENNIPTPESTAILKSEAFDEGKVRQKLEELPGPPYVVKPDRGTQGRGVKVAQLDDGEKERLINGDLQPEEAEELQTKRAIEHIRLLHRDEDVLVQEFIETRTPDEVEKRVKDIRVLVVGGEIVSAELREGGEGLMTANVSTGGRNHTIELTLEEKVIALKTAKESGLNMVGIDLMRDINQPGRTVVGEINPGPGLDLHEEADPKVYDRVVKDIAQYTLEQQRGGSSLPSFK